MPQETVTLGFKPHTGWAAIVAIAGEAGKPKLLVHRRVQLVPSDDSIPRFVYHEASTLDLNDARDLVARAQQRVRESADTALTEIVDSLGKRKVIVRSCTIVGSSARVTSEADLARILGSHPLIHASEGQLFRDAIAAACVHHGIAVGDLSEADTWRVAAKVCKCSTDTLRERLGSLRKIAGTPWAADEKVAMAAAIAATTR